MSNKKQGDLGVAAAIKHYMDLGFIVAFPLTDTGRYDLIVDKGGYLFRVEVKTTRSASPKGDYIVSLRTKGDNTSWNGLVKKISSTECDLVFVSTPIGNYEFPSSVLEDRSAITLYEKYKQYHLG